MPKFYLYIFEDGTVNQHYMFPSETDLVMVGDGTLGIYEFDPDHGKFYEVDSDGNYQDVTEAKFDKEYNCHVPG